MIHCFLTLCLVASPHICQPPIEIMPDDGHSITSPMQCGRGGAIYFTLNRMAQQTPEQLNDGLPAEAEWFPKISSKMDGDGSDIVRQWIEDQKARAARLAPQIK